MGFKIGICGISKFGRKFVELFNAHPLVDEVVLADVLTDRLHEVAKANQIKRTYGSLDELCQSDVDAVALFTQRWRHGPMAVQVLKAGKHVWSAVPAATTLEELHQLVETVEQTGLLYMLAETDYYHPHTVFCRRKFAAGAFGDVVYAEGQYYHDMYHFYRSFWLSNPDWKQYASLPPMYYSTHATSNIVGVTFGRLTQVSCLGYSDHHPDGIFDEQLSHWHNIFSNQTALYRTSDGGMARVNEFRRNATGAGHSTIIGTTGAFQEQTDGSGETPTTAMWSCYEQTEANPVNGIFDYEKPYLQMNRKNVADQVRCVGVEITQENLNNLPREYLGRKHVKVALVHPVERLPKEFVGLDNDHFGSHQFLVVDFIKALETGKLPPNHVWQAARYNAPGIVAHESAKREGELMQIPDFGIPPSDVGLLDPLSKLRN